MSLTHGHIDVHKCDFGGGGVPSELDGIVTVEAFKELGDPDVNNYVSVKIFISFK